MLKANNNYDLFNSFEQLSLTTASSSSSHSANGKAASSLYTNLVASTLSDEIARKSQNVTDCVPVPTSEHVAEIVGRQGCKIKALRAKTNTYIKTPIRGESPMFVITGRREDVNMAKKEILSAAEHFSQIRARRNNTNATNVMVNSNISSQQQQVPIQSSNQATVNQQSTFNPTPSTSPSLLSSSSSSSSSSSTRLHDSNGPTPTNRDAVDQSSPTTTTTTTQTGSIQQQMSTTSATSSPPNAGQVTIQVRVPYKVVGLVVGPKGTTIKRIQQQTQTYIITPSRERDPVFEITGQPDNVDAAKADIEAYIQSRMKSSFDGDDGDLVDDYYLDSDMQLPPSTTSVLKSTLNDSTLDSFLNNNDDDHHHHHQDTHQQQQTNNNNNEANMHVVNTILDFNPLSIWSTAPGLNANGNFNSEPLINQNSLFNNIYRSTSSSSSSSSSSCSSSASVSLSSSTTNCNQNPLQSLLLRTSPSQMQQQQQQQDQQQHQSLQLYDFTADAFLNDVNIVQQQQQQQPSQQHQDPILFSDLMNPTDASYMMQLMMQQVQNQQQQQQQQPYHQQIPKCVMCNNNIGYETFDSETPALLLPCRHNMFCLNCAQTLVDNMQPCPLCFSNVTQAIRIYS